MSKTKTQPKQSIVQTIKCYKWEYTFLLPAMILFIVFTIEPMYNILVYSFYEWDGYGALEKFVGFDNYLDALTNYYYWKAFLNTMIFALSHLILQTGIALFFAIILNSITSKLKNIYRLMIFIPVITTTSVIGMVMEMILDPVNGPINTVLMSSGILDSPIKFLGDKNFALLSVIMVSLWKNMGVSLIYWLAALQTVPKDVYESAKMDGAGPFKTFTKITLPIVAPFGAVIALFAFKNGLYPFDIVKTMTGGGPAFSSEVMDTYIYRYAFNAEQSVSRYGFASAAGILFAVSVIIVTLTVTKLISRGKNKSED